MKKVTLVFLLSCIYGFQPSLAEPKRMSTTVEDQQAKSLQVLKKKAEDGDDKAAYELGGIYADGTGGVSQSYEEAVEWLVMPVLRVS